MKNNFWKDKKVFLTGHTGFKGAWLSCWLVQLGADVYGYALEPTTSHSLFKSAAIENYLDHNIGDVRDASGVQKAINGFRPDIVFHMAAQSLVRYSFRNPVETYETNVMGTVNVFEAARHSESVRAIVNVTTDKCYENREWLWGYRENEAMGGFDPYSSSKGCAELVTSAYRRSFFEKGNIALASARAGNVIGGGDWAVDRLIPDILRSIDQKEPLSIRFPNATRPWQHVLDPLNGYLMLAENLFTKGQSFAQPWNFGPEDADIKSVEWIVRKMADKWGHDLNYEIDGLDKPHEAVNLKLDISKAKTLLGWRPCWKIDDALEMIIDWHRAYLNKGDMHEKCLEQIMIFQKRFRNLEE